MFGQAPGWSWAKVKGDTGWEDGYAIALDDSDNVYTTGDFEGTVDFDPGPGVVNLTSAGFEDIYISKSDSSGNLVWAKRIGGNMGGAPLNESGFAIALDATGNVYVTGHFTGTVDFDPGLDTFNLTGGGVFVLKLNRSGDFIWAKAMGGTGYNTGTSIALDRSGNIITSGIYQGQGDFDPDSVGTFYLFTVGSQDIFISKLDSAGNFMWAKSFQGNDGDEASTVAVDSAGFIYITGSIQGTMDFNPDSLTTFNLTSVGQLDIFICKLDPSGNLVWAKTIGGSDYDRGTSIKADTSGFLYITGMFGGITDFDPDSTATFNLTSAGLLDIFVAKLDTSCNLIWAKRMGGATNDLGFSISIDQWDNVYTTGVFNDTADFDPDSSLNYALISAGRTDIYFSKLNNAGDFIWAEAMGGPSFDGSEFGSGYGASLASNANGSIYITGGFASFHISLGSITLNNADTTLGTNDVFIGKLNSGLTIGVSEQSSSLETIIIYPNPSFGEFNISSAVNIDKLEITDVMGRVVYGVSRNITGGKNVRWQLRSDAPGGVYFVTVTMGEQSVMRKVVAQR